MRWRSGLDPIRGEITEIVGGPSSGRTSHLLACLGDVVSRGETAALVDTEETFDPESAAQAGSICAVSCGSAAAVIARWRSARPICSFAVRGFALVALDLGERVPRLPTTLAFRLKFAVRRTDVALLIVGRRRLTGASAALAVETLRDGIEWTGPGSVPTRLARVRTRPRVLRAARTRPAAVALVDRMSRFGCVLVEHFDAAAAERCEPALRERPLAVVDRPGRSNAAGESAPRRTTRRTARIMTVVEANAEARARACVRA